MIRAIALLVLLGIAGSLEPVMAADPTHREGVVSHMGPGFGRDYLALPVPRGTTVRICGPARCRVMTSNDFGPNQRIHPDRIADVGMATFTELCACPTSQGLFRGSWSVTDAQSETLPETATEPRDSEVGWAVFLAFVGFCVAILLAVRWPSRRSR